MAAGPSWEAQWLRRGLEPIGFQSAVKPLRPLGVALHGHLDPLLNYLWSDQALQGSRAHRQSCLGGLQRHHVCWANKAFLVWRSAQGCVCVPEAAISPRGWTLWLGSLCASVFSEWGLLDLTGCSFSGWTFGGYQPGLEAGRAISSEPAKGAPLGSLSLHPPPYLPFQKHNLSVYYQEIQTL